MTPGDGQRSLHSNQTTTSSLRAARRVDPTPDGRPAPIAIGGVGGSGTRVVAECLRSLGVFMGTDLNPMNDTLWFTLLFARQEILDATDAEFELLTRSLAAGLQGGQPLPAHALARIAALADRDRLQVSADWLRMRASSLAAATSAPPHGGAWGWKEPNTHLVIERLWQHLPSLRYVHVIRHGLDMALSTNQNQLRFWGQRALGYEGDVTPARSLAYWCWAQRRMERILRPNRGRMYWLDYDALCREPERTLAPLLDFLGFDAQDAGALAALVHPPKVPRHASTPLEVFSPDDVAYVESLGYPVVSRV
jgi:hypothetical protein